VESALGEGSTFTIELPVAGVRSFASEVPRSFTTESARSLVAETSGRGTEQDGLDAREAAA
jgi:hypothetical protein